MSGMDVLRLRELADRCEAASGPDRELDRQCHLAAGYRLVASKANERMPDVMRWIGPDGVSTGWLDSPFSDYPPRYTASLDAAMTLVPEGWAWCLWSDASCEIGYEPERGALLNPEFITECTSPALALCAASLRALAALEDAS